MSDAAAPRPDLTIREVRTTMLRLPWPDDPWLFGHALGPMRDLIVGLDRLRCPAVFTQIATFMLRYLDVLADDARRMRIARLARGYDPRFLWQVKAFAVSVGALFLRAYERGERVYLAMVSRGYAGRLPRAEGDRAPAGQWVAAAVLPAATAGIALAAALG